MTVAPVPKIALSPKAGINRSLFSAEDREVVAPENPGNPQAGTGDETIFQKLFTWTMDVQPPGQYSPQSSCERFLLWRQPILVSLADACAWNRSWKLWLGLLARPSEELARLYERWARQLRVKAKILRADAAARGPRPSLRKLGGLRLALN